MRVLVTGFGPFLDHRDNPSARLARALDRQHFAGVRFVAAPVLSVTYGQSAHQALTAKRAERCGAVLALGLAAKSERVRIEAVARNRVTSEHPDAAGQVRRGPIRVGAPAALRTGLDPQPVERALHAAGIAFERSQDAGGYVCNDLFFRLRAASVPAIFVHVPPAVSVMRTAAALARGVAGSVVASAR